MVELFLFGLVALFGYLGIRDETDEWNGGTHCDEPWIPFDISSQGCRGYRCDICGKYIWITYPWIDRREAKP